MKYLLFIFLPKELLSRCLGRLERLERPKWFVEFSKNWFVKRYRLNMSEAEKDLSAYRSLNQLFTRRLKAGLRPIESEVVHPCDAVISQCGKLDDGKLIQAKGWTYTAKELLGFEVIEGAAKKASGGVAWAQQGENGDSGASLREGFFATYYLCPTDYHRVHFPVSGKLVRVTHLVGKLWPVNLWSVNHVRNLFCRNERVVFELDVPGADRAKLYMVMVGATNVGHITSELVPGLVTNRNAFRGPSVFDFHHAPIPVSVGDEAGIFQMGSTVILVANEEFMRLYPLQCTPSGVLLGQTLLPRD